MVELRFHGQLLCGAAAIALIVGFPGGAAAQSADTDDRIQKIERQIHSLEGEMQQLKGELGDAKKQLRQSRGEAAQAREQLRQAREAAAQAQQGAVAASSAQAQASQAAAQAQATVAATSPPPPGAPGKAPPHLVQTDANRFGIESADGRNSIYLTGRLHLDTGDYLSFRPDSKFASAQDLNSGVNARRARLGVTGKFAGDWQYTFIYDFGGSSDGLAVTGAPTSGIQSAFVTYNGLNKGKLPLAFDLGYMDTPFTLDEATSSNDIMFMERASIQTVATSLLAGDFRSAAGVRSNSDRYWAGIYMTGPTSGTSHTSGEPMGAFGRATVQALAEPDYSLHLGVDVGGLLKPPTTTVGGVANVPAVTLSDRPELRLDPTAILTTGAIGTPANPVTDAAVYGLEGAAAWRNLFLQGEYYDIGLDRRGLASNNFTGGYIEGSWTISGEHRKYIPSTGAYSSIVPDHPFEPWMENYGTGAWELAFRWSTIDLNNNFTPSVAPTATSNAVGGGTQTVYALGVNWYPNANMRFMWDFLHGDISKRFSTAAGGGVAGTPLGAPVGGSFDALAMRMQFAF